MCLVQVCLDGDHIYVFAVACILLVFLGVIYPGVTLYGARKLHHKESVGLFARVFGQKDSDEYQKQYYWFGGTSLLLVCCAQLVLQFAYVL